MSQIPAINVEQGRPGFAARPSGPLAANGRGGQQVAGARQSTPIDEIRLSPEARQFAVSSANSSAAGKAAQSTAGRAREIIEASTALADQPFGRIVSQVARGVLSLDDVTAEEPPAGAEPPAPDTGEADTAATQEVVTEGPVVDNAASLIGDLIDDLTQDSVDLTA